MTAGGWLLVTALILLVGLVLYWQLIIAEGAYFGARMVALLYDWSAERYNTIKEFDASDEDFCLGQPLVARLHARPNTTILDVATGTGRIPQVMIRQSEFKGNIIGIDRAAKMLNVAHREVAARSNRIWLVQADAMALPFASDSVPVVTCLEALEFLPSPRVGLAELVRVLRPAGPDTPSQGWLLTTNRIGWEALLMPGKTWNRKRLETELARLSLQHVNIQVWQDIYDLVWAQKLAPFRNDYQN
jgi:ubiquinone/menaquinone biosynthesis C-methylase UbiE